MIFLIDWVSLLQVKITVRLSLLQPRIWKWWILVLLVPLPPPLHFHQNVVILLVAIPPTNAEAADPAYRFRFHFRIPGEMAWPGGVFLWIFAHQNGNKMYPRIFVLFYMARPVVLSECQNL